MVRIAKRPKKRNKAEQAFDPSKPLTDAKWELFCQVFTTNTLPMYWGNGQNSFAFAFGHYVKIDAMKALLVGPAISRKGKSKPWLEMEIKRIENVCRSSASQGLTRINIKERCDWLLDRLSEHSIVDRELVWTIQQRRDIPSKVQAIRHHDQREQRIRERIDIKHEFEPIKVITITAPKK